MGSTDLSVSVASRAGHVRSGIRIEVLTVLWMAVESVVAIGSGVLAGSILLTAFGFDSVIELVSAGVLLRRLRAEAHQVLDDEELDRVERRAGWISAVLLALLCLYVLGSALLGLVTRLEPERSFSGLAVSAAALLVMPLLGWRKRVIAERIGSRALRADAAESITCAYMAGAVLLGLALHAVVGWWWVEYAAALPFLWWLVGETREAFEAARGEADHDDD